MSMCICSAQYYNESDSYANDTYVETFADLPSVRTVSGGTKLKTTYSDNVPMEMQGAFDYACKIWEEILPPCLPITVHVDCASIKDSGSLKTLSKVGSRAFENLGISPKLTAPITQIKYITLKEYEINSNHTFIDSIEDVSILTDSIDPDIYITYNKNLLEDFSFSIEASPTELYDFVTVALRDIAKGLGFVSFLIENPEVKSSLYISGDLFTPYDWTIWQTFGTEDKQQAYSCATQGRVSVHITDKDLYLYAPTTWQNGVSLSTFIPGNAFKVSKLLDHNFGRGFVYRDIADDSWDALFENLLLWRPKYPKGTSGAISSNSGSTEDLMPYNGAISIGRDSENLSYLPEFYSKEVLPPRLKLPSVTSAEVYKYCNKFHPFYRPNSWNKKETCWTVSILKKDGEWDLVYEKATKAPYINLSMDMFDFHFQNDVYARSCDGYLRARATHAYRDESTRSRWIYDAKFILIDYLPQAIEMEYSEMPVTSYRNVTAAATQTSREIKIGLKNLEGATKVVIERLREGRRVPSKIEIKDYKKGYFITSVENDINTTFTAVALNANGTTKSLPMLVPKLVSQTENANIKIIGNEIIISDVSDLRPLNYEIIPLQSYSTSPVQSGLILSNDYRTIPTDNLLPGIYIINYYDNNGGKKTYRFLK